MNQIKIGKFIAELRKKKNFTQAELAEKLGISNKTISKWECGKSIPDYSVLEELCMVLEVNIIEMLSGEYLSSDSYDKKVEESIMGLMQEANENRKNSKREVVISLIGIVGVLILFAMYMIAWGGFGAINEFIDTPILIYLFCVVLLIMILSGALKDFFKAFSYILGNETQKDYQAMRKALESVKYAIVTFNITGILFSVIGGVNVLNAYESLGENLATSLANVLLSICYSLLFSLLLVPVIIRLRNIIGENE